MFFHDKRLQYNAMPTQPDPLLAKKMQELIGGAYGEMTVMMQYLMQGWSCRGPQKYRDMLLDIGTEEIAHVEMLSTMVAHLLDKAPIATQEAAAAQSPLVAAAFGGMNPQHVIVSGLNAQPADSVGYPWNGRYVTASGNLLADFRANLNAESQGRLQAIRVYESTDDRGVRDMLSFMIARDTMHQNQWMAAIADLEEAGLETSPVPSSFPQSNEKAAVAYQFWNLSVGEESAAGRWAKGPSMDGKGQFEYVANPQPLGPVAEVPDADPRLFGTPNPGLLERVVNEIKK